MGKTKETSDHREFSRDESEGEPLTTADMAAAASAPTRARAQNQTNAAVLTPDDEVSESLFQPDEFEEFRSRWLAIQTGFVDQPRSSVEQADELVAAVMKQVAEIFSAERQNLESEWASGEDVSTEDLRIALRRYRSFFDRLLSV
jgi:hypothetical protein